MVCYSTAMPERLVPLLPSKCPLAGTFGIESFNPHIAVLDVPQNAGGVVRIWVTQNHTLFASLRLGISIVALAGLLLH